MVFRAAMQRCAAIFGDLLTSCDAEVFPVRTRLRNP